MKFNFKFSINLYIFLIGLMYCLQISCANQQKDLVEISNIEILYVKGFIEFAKALNCEDLHKNQRLVNDTVISDRTILKEIEKRYYDLKAKQLNYNKASCDIRLKCKLYLTNGDSIQICIGQFNCISFNNFICTNDTFSYLIKKNSGFYNYFSKEELMLFQEFKYFKIPDNYIFINNMKFVDGIPIPQ